MYCRLKLSKNGYGFPRNYFIYDSNDDSVEFLTDNEFDLVNKEVCVYDRYIDADDALLAKIVLTSNNIELFNNGFIKLNITYNDKMKHWYLNIYALDSRICDFSPLDRGDRFRWDYCNGLTAHYEAIIPSYYVSYLFTNKSARDREVKKILRCTTFSWRESLSEGMHITKGMGFLRKFRKVQV